MTLLGTECTGHDSTPSSTELSDRSELSWSYVSGTFEFFLPSNSVYFIRARGGTASPSAPLGTPQCADNSRKTEEDSLRLAMLAAVHESRTRTLRSPSGTLCLFCRGAGRRSTARHTTLGCAAILRLAAVVCIANPLVRWHRHRKMSKFQRCEVRSKSKTDV